MAVRVLSLSLPCSNEAPKLARNAVSRLSGIDSIRDDVILVASELVSNAVMHSGSVGKDSIILLVDRKPGALTIYVRDPGRSQTLPRLRSDGDRGRGGFGLVLVNQLARRWGNYDEHGRVVWAQLSMSQCAT